MGYKVSSENKSRRMDAAPTLFASHLEESMIDQGFLVFTLFCSKFKSVHNFDLTTVLSAQEPADN